MTDVQLYNRIRMETNKVLKDWHKETLRKRALLGNKKAEKLYSTLK